MKSLKQDASYIEKMTVQDTNETDWLGFNGTTLSYKPESMNVSVDSTATSLTYSNNNAGGKDVVLVTTDDGSDSLHKLYVDGNNVVYDGLDLATITEASQLTANDAQSDDEFGSSVAITSDGLVAMVGARYGDTAADDAGKVYTYKRTTIDDAWTEVNQLTASDAQSEDEFGSSVAITGDGLVAMVGAFAEDTSGIYGGKVYTYKRATIDDAWSEVNQLTASDTEDGDFFGRSVAITSDGLVAMVGAYWEDTAADDAGKVYTYKRATIDDAWTEVSQLTASDAEASDFFGASVAITGDGLVAMVGAREEGSAAASAGKVYAYKRATIDDNWTEVSQLTASDAEDGDFFGSSVAITSDGLVAMIGAYGEDTTASNAGKVYVYKRATIDDAWSEVNQLTASDAQSDDFFGTSIAITSDGLVAMIGAQFEDTAGSDAGKVYTYNIANRYTLDITDVNLPSAPTYGYIESDVLLSITAEVDPEHMLTLPYERATISATDATNKTITIDKLAFKDTEVVINNESYTINAVVNNSDFANTYTITVNDFDFTSTINSVYVQGSLNLPVKSSSTTSIVSITATAVVAVGDTIYVDDNEVVINDITIGGVDMAINEVNQLTASDAEANDHFGSSVAITGDGLVTIVGARDKGSAAASAGKVYTYKRATIDDNWTEVNQLTASDAEDGDYFGTSVAITPDGLVAMVGAYKEDTAGSDAGKVYTYKRATIDDDWTEVNQLTASDAEADDYFGVSVAITGDGLVAIVGAYAEDTAASDAGKAYTYKRATIDDAWTEVSQLTASDAHSDDHFGASVAITGDGLVAMVGSILEDTVASNAGKVYTYRRTSIDDAWTEVNMLTASDAENGTFFGRSTGLTEDGLVAIVGSEHQDTSAGDSSGQVYLYKRATIDDAWSEIDKFVGSDITDDDSFGISSTITKDGSIVMVGAWFKDTPTNNAGKVYTYNTSLGRDITLTIPEQSVAPTTAAIIDRSVLVPVASSSYSNGAINLTYKDHVKRSRAVQRKLTATGSETIVTSDLVTSLTKLS